MTNNDDWRKLALCIGKDPALWDAGKGKSTPEQLEAGQRHCGVCPVLTECLTDALRDEPKDGAKAYTIRGGMNGAERAALNRRANRGHNEPPSANRLPPEEHARRRYVAERVMDDGHAAAQLGLTRDAFNAWRKRYFIDRTGRPKRARNAHLTPDEQAQRRNLHAQGFSDAAIAEAVGVSKSIVQRWRNRNKLPCNYGPATLKASA